MFTPHRVAGCPRRDIILKGERITKGTFVASGKEFEIVDSYVDPSSAHRMLNHGWIGTSKFLDEEIDEKQNGGEKQKRLVWPTSSPATTARRKSTASRASPRRRPEE